MKKVVLIVLAAFLVFCCGCVIGDVHVQEKSAPLPETNAPVRSVTQAEANFSVAAEVNTKLRVAFRNSPAEKTFNSKLAQRLADRIILDKAEVMTGNQGDVFIVIMPEFELVDRSGEYYRINCKQVGVTIRSASKVYATTAIEPENMPRKLGIQNAKEQYLPRVADALVPFLEKNLDRLSRDEIAVSTLDFGLANIQEQPESQLIAGQINRIAQILGNTPGIVKYTNIRQDVARATCTFRVVYLKDKFPRGIANVINSKLAAK